MEARLVADGEDLTRRRDWSLQLKQIFAADNESMLQFRARLPLDGSSATLNANLRKSFFPERWASKDSSTILQGTRVDVMGDYEVIGPRSGRGESCLRLTKVVNADVVSSPSTVSSLRFRAAAKMDHPSGKKAVEGFAEASMTIFGVTTTQDLRLTGGVSATAPVRESGGSLRLGDPEVSPYVELRENNVSLRADFKRGRAMLRMAYDL